MQIQLAQKTIDTALENLRLNEDHYHADTGILTDLLDAQTSPSGSRLPHQIKSIQAGNVSIEKGQFPFQKNIENKSFASAKH